MKRLLAVIICLFAAAGLARATVTLELDAGVLRNALGTATVPVGGLLQIIATPGGTFSPPTATSFTSGDNVVLATLAMNYNVGPMGTMGITDNTFTFSLQTTGTAAGDELMLRWYPTLTTASTAPGIGATYGQFRSSTGENGGSAWVIPADGASLFAPRGLNFYTTDVPSSVATGTHLPMTGYATNVVALIPEPSACAICGCAVACLVGVGWRGNRRGHAR